MQDKSDPQDDCTENPNAHLTITNLDTSGKLNIEQLEDLLLSTPVRSRPTKSGILEKCSRAKLGGLVSGSFEARSFHLANGKLSYHSKDMQCSKQFAEFLVQSPSCADDSPCDFVLSVKDDPNGQHRPLTLRAPSVAEKQSWVCALNAPSENAAGFAQAIAGLTTDAPSQLQPSCIPVYHPATQNATIGRVSEPNAVQTESSESQLGTEPLSTQPETAPECASAAVQCHDQVETSAVDDIQDEPETEPECASAAVQCHDQVETAAVDDIHNDTRLPGESAQHREPSAHARITATHGVTATPSTVQDDEDCKCSACVVA